MRYSGFISALAVLGTTLAGCAERPSLAPDILEQQGVAALGAEQVVQAVRGSGHLELAGELRTFTFTAQKRADGSVSGEFQIIARQVDRVTHGQITCMTVYGSSAWLGGVIERDDSGVSTGAEALFRVVDLGQAPGGTPDLMSLLNFTFASGAALRYCNAAPPFPAIMPVNTGEIVVTQPGSMSFTASTVFPVNLGVYVPCAVGGAGELVLLSGELHSLYHFTDDGAGGFRVMNEVNPQGLSGTGLTSGDKYQGTGVSRSDYSIGSLPYTTTFVNNFRMIGEGPGNNLLIHETFHVTVNANGTLSAFVDNFSAECQ